MFDLRKIQRSREISESEVLAINYIQKRLALRYIAAGEEQWLYPERHLENTAWRALGDEFFLMPDPRKVHFTTATTVGFRDGSAWAENEYGHRDLDNARATALREVEWSTFQRHKDAWNARDAAVGREPPSDIRDYLFG